MFIKKIMYNNNTPRIARSIICTFFISVAFLIQACGGNEDEPNPTPTPGPETESMASSIMQSVWNTSSMLSDKNNRTESYATIQKWADECPSDLVFLKYLNADDATALALRNTYPALQCYDLAFDRILDALKNGLPNGAKPRVWTLFNMGIIVQTTSGNYAIDIYHRRGVELAPYIDFYAITHKHADHKWEPLAVAMSDLGKPVLTNFSIDRVNNTQYLSMSSKDYAIGNFNVHSFITHHNNSSPLTTLAITAFYIDGGGLKLLHSGDSNFIAEEFESMRNKDVDFYVFRYAVNALTENNIVGNIVRPKIAVLSHILELGHKDIANSRWSLQLGLDRAGRINSDNVAMPFWGDYLEL